MFKLYWFYYLFTKVIKKMKLRPYPPRNSRWTKVHQLDIRSDSDNKVRKPHLMKMKSNSRINSRTKINEHSKPHQYMIRRRPMAKKRKHCLSCQSQDEDDESVELYPKLVLDRCPNPDSITKKSHQTRIVGKMNLNPRIILRPCNLMRFLGNTQKDVPRLIRLTPNLILHRCKVQEVLDHRVVKASHIEAFMVELYPLLIRTWVNPRDFIPQKYLFDEYVRRHAVPGHCLSAVSPIQTCRIMARRILPNGDVQVLWM